jgi:hypothetical protein
MLHPVPTVRLMSRPRSLPVAMGAALALIVLTAAPASAQGPGGAAALVGDEQPVAAAPGAAPQPVAGGITPVAPPEVLAAVTAANSIAGFPYKWGGGHGSFQDSGYDCSGAVSHVLHAVGVLDDPLDSSGFKRWGERGKGQWITVYTNRGHAYVVIAGLRFDTSGRGGKGPRWRTESRPSAGFVARHPEGL